MLPQSPVSMTFFREGDEMKMRTTMEAMTWLLVETVLFCAELVRAIATTLLPAFAGFLGRMLLRSGLAATPETGGVARKSGCGLGRVRIG